MSYLGKCVKVNGDFYRLVRRLHLVWFRCTEQPTSLLLPALLTSFRKRTYPQYRHKRDKSIWPTREDLLNYEEALELEAKLEEVASKTSEREREPKTPTPATPIGKILCTPRTPFITPKGIPLLSSGGKEEPEEWNDDAPVLPEVVDVEEEEESSVRKAKKVKAFMDEKIYPKWKEFIEAKGREGCSARKPGLERFEPGMLDPSQRFTRADIDACVIRVHIYTDAPPRFAFAGYPKRIPGRVQDDGGIACAKTLPPRVPCKVV